MINRLQRGCVVLVLVGSVLVACGDDEGSSSGTVAATAGSGSQRPVSAAAARAGSAAGSGARRGILGGQMCPMTEAEATGGCTPARGTCTFGERICDCSSDTMTWACWAPSDCPTSVPAEQSTCSVVGMACTPMPRRNCNCTPEGWDCGNQYCPAAEPALGSACEGGDGVCTFGSRTCDCDNSLWVCWDPKSDCPAAPPLDRSACSLDGVVCQYDGGSCECNGGMGWRCGRGVMNDPDDAGVPSGNTGAAGASAGNAALGGAGASAGAGAGAGGMSGPASAGTTAAAGSSGSP